MMVVGVCVECARCVCLGREGKCAGSGLCPYAEAESGGLGYFGSTAAPYRSGGALHPGPRRVVCGSCHEPRELRGGRAASFAGIREAGPRGSARARAPHPAASRAGIPLPRCPGSASPGRRGEGRGGALLGVHGIAKVRVFASLGRLGKAWPGRHGVLLGNALQPAAFRPDLSGGPRSWPQC